MKQIPAPRNVRAVYADGREVPLRCRYRGCDNEGLHVWIAVITISANGLSEIRADEIPEHTRIDIEFEVTGA